MPTTAATAMTTARSQGNRSRHSTRVVCRFVRRASKSFECQVSLQAGQSGLEALQPLLDGPEIHSEREQLVHLGNGPRIEGQVDRLEILAALLARLDAHADVRGGVVGGELRR